MPPVRRYLRITEYSVLEVRIYLEVPALAQTWLLNPRDDVLTRIITAVRPHVFRQLWDDRNHVKSKGKKKKGVKDVAFGGGHYTPCPLPSFTDTIQTTLKPQSS